MEQEQFFILLDKYLSNETDSEEEILLFSFYESFQTPAEWDESLGEKEVTYRKMLSRLQNAIVVVEEAKVIPIKRFVLSPIFKFAIAATIILLISLNYIFKEKNSIELEKTIVVNNNEIKPGSDKAILTLEDGSVVMLGKDNVYKTQNVSSNGENIEYNSQEKKSSKVVFHYLTTPRGGEFFIKLSDGTQVWLNSASQLKFPVGFIQGETRTVELVYGEAYFDVSPSSQHGGDKFKVWNQSQSVEVVGTEFNIKAYKDDLNIFTTLVKGKVVVENGISKRNLTPNQQSNLDLKNKNISIYEVDVDAEISWRKGIFSFSEMTLKEIMKVISRWYDVDIVFKNKNLESIKFKGTLSKEQNIEEILSIMKSSTINGYEIKNRTIIIN